MENLSEKAFKFVKKNRKLIKDKFINGDIESNKKPVFIFMAGAPGAGKTETSKWLIKYLKEEGLVKGFVRIDADEIREMFRPLGYDGKNSDDFKRACVKGVEILFDASIKNKYHTVIDGTLASLKVAQKNIGAARKNNADIFIVYVYQDPLIAWGFAKIREMEEGRKIKKEMFVNSFFESIATVNAIKKEYGKKVELWLVEKHITNETKKIHFNIENIDNYLKTKYNPKDLMDNIYEE